MQSSWQFEAAIGAQMTSFQPFNNAIFMVKMRAGHEHNLQPSRELFQTDATFLCHAQIVNLDLLEPRNGGFGSRDWIKDLPRFHYSPLNLVTVIKRCHSKNSQNQWDYSGSSICRLLGNVHSKRMNFRQQDMNKVH